MERSSVGCSIELWSTGDDNDVLYNPKLLDTVSEDDMNVYNSHGVSHCNPGNGLLVRPLNIADYNKGYVTLLSQLSEVGDIDQSRFEMQFNSLKKCPGIHYITVIEDLNKSIIIGSASLIVERKFLHEAALRGRIEDVVIHGDYRGRHLACMLIELLNHLGKALGCYKLSLDCKPPLGDFYGKFGYHQEPVIYMVKRFYN